MAELDRAGASAAAVAPTAAAATAVTAAWRLRVALALMVASGFAALGYQIVWTQQAAAWLGHESAAVLAVVAAFFGGLAVGALALAPRIERSAHPARGYAACEVAIGLWSLALAVLIAPAGRLLLGWIGAQPSPAWHWTVAFAGTFALLLPATAAMGATLPVMERALAALRREGSSIAALYAGNTAGAVAGVLAAAFWLVPGFGLARTAALCAALNLLCAVATLVVFARAAAAPAAAPARAAAPAPGLAGLLAANGLLGIGYEVLVVRVLSQVSENTVYTFAMLLAVYLVGTALGAAAYHRWRQPRNDDGDVRRRLLLALSAACLAGSASLWAADAVKAAVLGAFEPSLAAALAAEAALALVAFLPPTLVMGALFSHLAIEARCGGLGFGRALGVNTLGAAAAPPLFGVLLVPLAGPKAALVGVAAGYLALAGGAAWRLPVAWAIGVATLALAAVAPPLAFVDVPEGGRVVSHRDGVMAAVSVVEDADGVATLRINNRQQEGSSATRVADARQALLPLLLHPQPRSALFLGLGTGVTAASAAADRELRVDAVELLPEVIEASEHFIGSSAAEPVDTAVRERLRVLAADARRYVRAAPQRYDVIVSDNFHPARSGSAALYTVEHFAAVRERLADGGLFVQWLPLHQLDLETLRSIVRSFVAVHRGGWAMLATNSLETPVLGLVARRDGGRFDVAQVRRRVAAAAIDPAPGAFGLHDEFALLGSFVAGPTSLARFAAGAPLNTDDHPVVAYRAPRITYAPDSRPRDRLLALLRELDVAPDDVVDDAAERAFAARLGAYLQARDRFLEVGRDVRPSADVRRMLAQVREPLLDVLRVSPDFRPAREPLLAMARALAQVDPAGARQLIVELDSLRPAPGPGLAATP